MTTTEAERRKYKAGMPRVMLGDIHTRHCRVLPSRDSLLDLMPKDGVVAEIGVAFGDFTAEIIARSSPKELHLIDAWAMERYGEGRSTIEAKFGQLIDEGSIILHQGYSIAELKKIEDSSFDWVYIDTNHSYVTTFEELSISSKKVKPGGILSGHDFCTGNVVSPVPYGVIEACNHFCHKFNWTYLYLTLESHGHFSFALKSLDTISD